MITEDIFKDRVFCDYSIKLKNMDLVDVDYIDVNQLLMFFNYSFYVKNDFFCENFNKRNLKVVYNIYYKIKSNILNGDVNDVFKDFDVSDVKMLKFLISNFIKIFDSIEQNDEIFYKHLKKESFKRLLKTINNL